MNPRGFFDFAIDGNPIGRYVFSQVAGKILYFTSELE